MKKIGKFITSLGASMYLFATKVLASGLWDEASTSKLDSKVSGNATSIMKNILVIVKPVSIILVFIAVLMVGFEIIMKRNKADDRMASMSSLLWVGIGALVIGGAGLVADAVFNALNLD